MAGEIRYSVVLKKTADFKSFDSKMSTPNSAEPNIPSRSVKKPTYGTVSLSNRQDTYLLTPSEVESLKNDPNVDFIHPWVDDRYLIQSESIQYNIDTSRRPVPDRPMDQSNQGLIIHTISSSYCRNTVGGALPPFGLEDYETEFTYSYALDGTGVDVIIMDGAINQYHEDWLSPDKSRNRFQAVDWPVLLGISNDNTINFFPGWYGNQVINNSSYDSHGMAVGSIVAGAAHGWAKNANVYFIRIAGYLVAGEVSQATYGATPAQAANMVRLFHESKSIDPELGYKRPTVVQASFGYNIHPGYFKEYLEEDITHVNKVFYSGSFDYDDSEANGLRNDTLLHRVGINNDNVDTDIPLQVPSIDSAFEEMCDAGVIFCHSAGNDGKPMWASGSSDDPDFDPFNHGWFVDEWYNSYFTYDTASIMGPAGTKIYYMRPSSPNPNATICVGALNYQLNAGPSSERNTSAYKYNKAYYSNKGPRIDCYAINGQWCAGGARSTKAPLPGHQDGLYTSSYYSGETHPNGIYLQYRENGTSFCAPQVAGLAALYLQLNPTHTSSLQVKKWLRSISHPIETGSKEAGDWQIGLPSSPDYDSTYGPSDFMVPRLPLTGSSPLKVSNINLNFSLKVK